MFSACSEANCVKVFNNDRGCSGPNVGTQGSRVTWRRYKIFSCPPFCDHGIYTNVLPVWLTHNLVAWWKHRHLCGVRRKRGLIGTLFLQDLSRVSGVFHLLTACLTMSKQVVVNNCDGKRQICFTAALCRLHAVAVFRQPSLLKNFPSFFLNFHFN